MICNFDDGVFTGQTEIRKRAGYGPKNVLAAELDWRIDRSTALLSSSMQSQ
jgi:hypothetical protein